MSDVSLKDFDILSEQDKAEAVALLNRYEQLDKQDACQKILLVLNTCGQNLSKVVTIK